MSGRRPSVPRLPLQTGYFLEPRFRRARSGAKLGAIEATIRLGPDPSPTFRSHQLGDGAIFCAAVFASPRTVSPASRSAFLPSGTSLVHRLEKKQQIDRIKFIVVILLFRELRGLWATKRRPLSQTPLVRALSELSNSRSRLDTGSTNTGFQ